MTRDDAQFALAAVTAAVAGDDAGLALLTDTLDEQTARLTVRALADLAARLLVADTPPARLQAQLRDRLLALAEPRKDDQ